MNKQLLEVVEKTLIERDDEVAVPESQGGAGGLKECARKKATTFLT